MPAISVKLPPYDQQSPLVVRAWFEGRHPLSDAGLEALVTSAAELQGYQVSAERWAARQTAEVSDEFVRAYALSRYP